MKCLVTGAAGFIGSHLCQRLLDLGHTVTGIDAFIPYYPRPVKEANLASIVSRPSFSFHECDLRSDDLLHRYWPRQTVVFHLGGDAGTDPELDRL